MCVGGDAAEQIVTGEALLLAHFQEGKGIEADEAGEIIEIDRSRNQRFLASGSSAAPPSGARCPR